VSIAGQAAGRGALRAILKAAAEPPERTESGGVVVQQPDAYSWIAPAVSITLVCLIVVVVRDPHPTTPYRARMAIVTLLFMFVPMIALGVALQIETRRRITVDELGILEESPWRRAGERLRCIAWPSVERVRYGLVRETLEIRDVAGTVIRISVGMRGVVEAADEIEKRLPSGICGDAVAALRARAVKLREAAGRM